MKQNTMLMIGGAIVVYLLWKKYIKKPNEIIDEGFYSDEIIGGSKLDVAMLECKSESIIHFEGSKASEEVKKEWIKNCVNAKMLEK